MSDLVFGGVVALFFVIIILGIGMAVTSEPVRLNQQFTDERMLVKICNDGTRVFLWREGSIPRRIGVPPEELCK